MSKPIPSLTLTQKEQNYLERFVNQGKRSARAIKRARILLYRHAGKTPKDTRKLVEVSLGTVCNVSARYHAEGLQAALEEKPRSGQPVKLNLRQQAELTTLCCSEAPCGHARWTIRLLADKAVELEIVDRIAPETIRQFLKKINLSLG
jgi:putative transposase